MFKDFAFVDRIDCCAVWYTKRAIVLISSGAIVYVKNIELINHIYIDSEHITIYNQKGAASQHKYPQTRSINGPIIELHIINEVYNIIEELLEVDQFEVIREPAMRELFDNWSRNLI